MNELVQAVLLVAGALVTFDAALRIASALMGETVGRRWQATRKLRKLGAGADLEYFREILGVPVSVRSGESLTESVWMHRHFFVQALSTSIEGVRLYSVTSRSKWFRPPIPFPGGGQYSSEQDKRYRARLNKTPFDRIAGHGLHRVAGDFGARRFWYSEFYAFGNPSHYQELVVSINDAADVAGDSSGIVLGIEQARGSDGQIDVANDAVRRSRRTAAPNTYSVTAPHFSVDDLNVADGYFGVDLDAVRVVPVR